MGSALRVTGVSRLQATQRAGGSRDLYGEQPTVGSALRDTGMSRLQR